MCYYVGNILREATVMKRKLPALPEYPEQANLEQAARRALAMDEDVEQLCFMDDAMEGLEGQSLTFSSCVFRRVRFGENALEHLSFVDCQLDHCDFSGFKLLEGALHRVEFLSCRGMGAQFDRSSLRDVLFRECRVGYLTLSECKLNSAEFVDCELENLLLYGCTLKSTVFEACRMPNAEVSGTSLKGIDLSGDDISGLRAPLSCREGAIVSALQAPELCALLGIKVK